MIAYQTKNMSEVCVDYRTLERECWAQTDNSGLHVPSSGKCWLLQPREEGKKIPTGQGKGEMEGTVRQSFSPYRSHVPAVSLPPATRHDVIDS